jgi:hypothetical protein
MLSVSVCSKQTEVCHFHFPFAANKQKFSVNSVSRLRNPGNMEIWRHGDGDRETWIHRYGGMETGKHGEMETWRHRTWRHMLRHRDMETWRHGVIETWTWKHGDIKREMENGSPANFPNPYTVSSSCKRKFIICPFVDEETNGRYSFANGINGLYGLYRLYGIDRLNELNGLNGHLCTKQTDQRINAIYRLYTMFCY